MIFEPKNLKTNYTKPEYAIADTKSPVFSWSAKHQKSGAKQSAYRITVTHNDNLLWDSGFVKSSDTTAVYSGGTLPSGALITWQLQLKDDNENLSSVLASHFKTACFDGFGAQWIASATEKAHEVQYFKKNFTVNKKPSRAVLYSCGLGLSKPYLNGKKLDDFYLQPAHTNYKKEASYIISLIDTDTFNFGENELEIQVAGGWRKNYGVYLDNMSSDRKIEFMGDMCLFAQLVLYFEDGEIQTIITDDTWQCSPGPVCYSHLFNGEVFDEYIEKNNYKPVIYSDFYPEKLTPQCIEPVCVKRELAPQAEYSVNGKYIYDFGENLAGVIKLKANGNCKNARFVLRHAEEVDAYGELFCDTLRSAEATDTYIPKNGYREIEFIPQFTYHGFRYASLEIQGEFDGSVSVTALNFYTDIDTDGFFKCGNQTVNEFYKTVIRTERANLHSLATDCPQRDERMAWMNDATVRFMAMPYNFNIARLFEKISCDIKNEQDETGRLTCTAPFVYGERPADPVCSAYLIAAYEHFKLTGDTNVIKKHYTGFKAWNNFLKSHAENGIVDYSYYGDWAGPADCCYSTQTIGNSDVLKPEEYDPGAANSSFVPGEMISTAIYYMNLNLLSIFSKLIGAGDEHKYEAEAKRVQKAYLDRWFYKKTASVHNSSQGVQALSLYVGIIPKEFEEKAATVMAEAVISDGYRLKTANITTPMLLQMLSKFGYSDIAWKLLARTEYPSWGYMIENGATTVWERFELKKESGMNSHNHPMYGAASAWLYKSLAGFDVLTPNKSYKLCPNIPKDLLYFEMKIPLLSGEIYLKCEKKYGHLNVFVDVPFGINTELSISGKIYNLDYGFHSIQI